MDVAKYIGLFLLKNNSCYIHGLGNLEFIRKPASYDGTNLIPATYEVVVAAANSIDDSLSNFIATNEQISISKATTALKDFSTKAKIDLAQGKAVEIPSLGNFTEVNSKLIFNTFPHLQHTGAPIAAEKSMPKRAAAEKKPLPELQPDNTYQPAATKIPEVSDPYEYPEPSKGKSLNWGRIILFVLILLAIIAGIGFAVKNMIKPGSGMYSETAAKMKIPEPDTVASQIPAVDSNSVEATTVTNADGSISFKVILNTYDTRRKAEKRYQTLTRNGNLVELHAEDSATYFILMGVQAPTADTARVVDSLRVLFNPQGVYVY